jgi:hypothetical protein
VRVLRARHPFLDKAAADALRQWRYSPLVLNGVETPFVLTVTSTSAWLGIVSQSGP